MFNRITFPAFLGIPALYLVPHYLKRPFSLGILIISAFMTAGLAIALDTSFYHPEARSLGDILRNPVITPLNNFLYNSSKDNLAQHGLHPWYQHLLVNLPQLLGPALLLVRWDTFLIAPALVGTLMLSLSPHQEARFLLPAVPLLISCVNLPSNPLRRRIWLAIWIAFNALGGLLMGVYHQGGIVPTQLWISDHLPNHATVYWWKTYSPPAWLGPGVEKDVNTVVLKGMRAEAMVDMVGNATCGTDTLSRSNVYLVAPNSSTFLDQFHAASTVGNGLTTGSRREPPLKLESVWTYRHHINLDDLDFGDDGVMPTLRRVVGRRGITVWKAERIGSCDTW
jgi:phosphatidylinositol glycan class Z